MAFYYLKNHEKTKDECAKLFGNSELRASKKTTIAPKTGENGAILLGFSGLILVDIDQKNDDLAYAKFVSQFNEEQENELLETCYEITGSDGLHFYFEIGETPLTFPQNNQGKVFPNVDILHGNQISFCAPSHFTDKGHTHAYEWKNGPEYVKPLPDWLRAFLENKLSHKPALTVVNPMIEKQPIQPIGTTQKERLFKALLLAKDNNAFPEYGDWLALGMALKEAGYTFDDWKELSTDLKETDNVLLGKWNGFTNGKGIGTGTLFHYAKEYLQSFTVPFSAKDDTTGRRFENENEAMSFFEDRFFVARVGIETYIFLRNTGEILHRPEKFHETFSGHKFAFVEKQKNADIERVMNASRVWFERTVKYDGTDYRPDLEKLAFFEEDGKHLFNTFSGFPYEAKRNDNATQPFYTFLDDVLAHYPNKRAIIDFLLDWIAEIFQNPTSKKNAYAVALQGNQGIGKGAFANVLLELFGGRKGHGVEVNSVNEIAGEWTNLLKNKIFVFADEAFWSGDRQAMNAIKGLITEKTLTIREKHIANQTQKNCLHFLTATNNDWSAPVEKGDRRWFVLRFNDCHRNDKVFFEALYNPTREMFEGLMYDFQNRNISGFPKKSIPDTEERMNATFETESKNDVSFSYFANLLMGDDCFLNDDSVVKTIDDNGRRDIAKKALYGNFHEYCVIQKVPFPPNEIKFGKAVKKFFPSIDSAQKMKVGKDTVSVYRYHFGTMKADFDSYMKGE